MKYFSKEMLRNSRDKENEDMDHYRMRRRMMNSLLKTYLRGTMVWNSSNRSTYRKEPQ